MSYSKTDIRKYLDKSAIHIQKGKVRRAIKELQKGLEAEPWNIDVAYQIASLYQRMNERINAISVFQNNLELLERKKNEMNLKDYNNAKLMVYKAILSLDPVDIAVRIKVGKYYLAQENKQKAAYLELFAAFNQCLVVKDEMLTAEVKNLLERVNLNTYERELLSAQFFHSIRDEEKYQELFFELIEKYSSSIKYLKGIFEKHLSFYPYDEKIIRRYCMLLVQIKDYRSANSMLRKTLGVKPDNLFFLELLSITSVRLNLLEESLELFYKLEEVYKKNRDEQKLELAKTNIEILKRKIELKNFPKEMPPVPGDSSGIDPQKESEALEDLKTIVEKSLSFQMIKGEDYEKDTLIDKHRDVPEELKILIEEGSENPTELMTAMYQNKAEEFDKELDIETKEEQKMRAQEPHLSFDLLKNELIDFTLIQERDFEVEDSKKVISLFFNKVAKEISADYRACIDMGVACFTFGYKEVAVGFYKMALKAAPDKEASIRGLIEMCGGAAKKVNKSAA